MAVSVEAFVQNPGALEEFLSGVHSTESITGLTHCFYRYPACFSPRFAAAAINAFTKPGDLVLDPFMGGGTTIVEATARGRRAIGLDINSLACFITRAKTTILEENDIKAIRQWAEDTVGDLHMWRPAKRAAVWIDRGYQRNINTRRTWPIRKCIEFAVDRVSELNQVPQQEVFARALILKTAQWALDCRTDVPSAEKFRQKMSLFLDDMIAGAKAYREFALSSVRSSTSADIPRPKIFNRSTAGAEADAGVIDAGIPRLVLTSPPYPGVHVMYHRWQVLGRRETPAPYWVADSLDGNGLSFYTFGGRHHPELQTYFDAALSTFRSAAKIANSRTIFVQMVAFSDAAWQLPQYIEALNSAGLREIKIPTISNSEDGRVWRRVPHRRWYADQRGPEKTGREVVLFHSIAD